MMHIGSVERCRAHQGMDMKCSTSSSGADGNTSGAMVLILMDGASWASTIMKNLMRWDRGEKFAWDYSAIVSEPQSSR